MYGNNYHYWQLRQNMSSWFSTRQINIILSYQHICNNQIIWRMFQCIGQHRYLFSVSSLIMEAILASDVVPLSECLLLKKKISRTLSLFFLQGYEKFTEALSLNILTDHYSPQAWIHSYCSTLTESRSLLYITAPSFCTAEIVFSNNSISALVNESTKNEFHMLLLR